MENGSMNFAAEKLVDWNAARKVGRRVAGDGVVMSAVERARLFEDFSEVVPQADKLVEELTGLNPGDSRVRPWVMTRNQWLDQNIQGFSRVIEPFARKVVAGRGEGLLVNARRAVLGAQIGALLGYLGRRVLGQYDVFLPPDDEGLIYFVGSNVVGVERKFQFPERDFRFWISSHEVAHRVQFGGVPWLRGHLAQLMESYLGSVEVDPGWLLERLKEAVAEVRSGRAARGFGWVFLLMSPDQRDMVRQMQAMMSLLEGHGNFVMDEVAKERIPNAAGFRKTLQERRSKAGIEKTFQKAIGFDVKVRQYDMGQRFVSSVVSRVGMEGFNKVWESPATLPTMEEIERPEAWVARVAAS
jgi:coenzyme F420 biosynthesis associated uncharacterized protein